MDYFTLPLKEMKAALLERFGKTNALQFRETPTPSPKSGEALVRVNACALNHLDLFIRNGSRELALPHVMGSDVCGTIEQLNGKSALKIGREVIVNPSIPCQKCDSCQKGGECDLVTIFGYRTRGGYAEYVAVPIEQLYEKPKHLSIEEAAAFPLTFLTAWRMLHTKAKLQRGETVFIWGASGGLGTAAVQIAKQLGARVIAAAGSGEKAVRLKKIGADEAVLYKEKNALEKVKELTNGKGVDVVFECVGRETWEKTIEMAKFCGRIVIAGTASGDIVSQDLSELYYKQLIVYGSRMGNREEFEEVLSLANGKKMKPVVDSVFPLQDASKALEKLESGKFSGKIVLKV